MERIWLKSYESEVPPDIDGVHSTMVQVLERAVAENPGGCAISYFSKRISYHKLGQLVSQIAIALHRIGIRKGDRLALMLPNIPQYVVFHFAAMKIGAILVPTNPLYVARELVYQLNNSGAETIVTLPRFWPTVKQAMPETGLKNIIITRVREYLPASLKLLYPLKTLKQGRNTKVVRGPGIHFYEDLISEPFQAVLPEIKVGSDDIAMFLYTGGTTGVSKGAVLTHGNLSSNAIQIKHWYTDVQARQERILSVLPFFHSYGLTTCLHKAVLLQSTMILVPNPRDLRTVMSLIRKEHPTLLPGVPTLFVAINNYPNVENLNLSSIKGCVSGGAPLPLEVSRRFEKVTGGKLVEGYGLSEASPVTHANPIHGQRKEGSIGVPLPSTFAKIVDPETKKPLATGEVGELAISGPQVMQGYWQMEKETKLVLKDGWLYTGDIARADEDGYFYIVDRQKDMIIAGGFNIFPREIEEVLYEHPKILEAAVIGAPDDYRGETVKAFVVIRPGEVMSEKEVTEFCKERLARFKVPKLIEFRETLPKSNIGKVLRRELKTDNQPDAGVTNGS